MESDRPLFQPATAIAEITRHDEKWRRVVEGGRAMNEMWTRRSDSPLPGKMEPPAWPPLTDPLGTVTLRSPFELALIYATDTHSLHKRKSTTVPYVAHLLGVASLVIEHGGAVEHAIAALLHDAVEDEGGPARLEEIRKLFGARVAELVSGCTEVDGVGYRERKARYVRHLATASPDVLLVSCADKLHNARALLADYRTLGDEVFERFNGSKDEVLWYYEALAEAFTARGVARLSEELARVVGELRRLAR
jgi:GTP pyrophosphokinase